MLLLMKRLAGPLLAALVLAGPVHSQTPVGAIKSLSGTATVIRAGQERPATLGMPLYTTDTLRTGTDGTMGVTLGDETRLSLGARTEVSIARYAYAPQDQQVGLTMRLVRGVLSYISGRIARLAPAAVRIETPTSIIGVRGTHLLIGLDQQ
jgi:hypothetical protein